MCCHASRSRGPPWRLPVLVRSGTRGPMFSKCGMPCSSSVRKSIPNSQRGRMMPSQASRRDGRSGVLKPLRKLFSRLAATGTSTVTTSVSKPPRAQRSTSCVMGPFSPGRYAWNHAVGPASRTRSSGVSEAPLVIIGRLASAAARASTTSPW